MCGILSTIKYKDGYRLIHTAFVVAWIIPMGKVKNSAMPQASNSPHHGSCSCLSKPSQATMARATIKTKIV